LNGQSVPPTAPKGPGAPLQDMADELQDCVNTLRADLDSPLAAMAQSLVSELREQVCRVAVIGQVKAGKSTFINALAGRPTMLPTDVNPWTAVVTKIHFGEPGAQEGASFEFFTEDEWRHMVGGGRMREMATSLAPNLDSAEIHKQLSHFEQRAKSRLGENFPQMLGRHHLFSSVTPGVLERYVTAGDDRAVVEGGIDETNAHFADIPKAPICISRTIRSASRRWSSTRRARMTRFSCATRSPCRTWKPPMSTSWSSRLSSHCPIPI